MKGYYYKPKCKCEGKCKCTATWSFTIDIGKDPKTGKRKQKKKGGFKTKKEAERAAAKLSVELDNGTFYEEKNISFDEFAYEWLEMYSNSGNVKESTVRIRENEIKRLLDYFAKLKLKDVTSKKYQDALLDLLKRNYENNTIDGAHQTGRMIFKKAKELEIIAKDPTEFATVPKKQKTVDELENETTLPNYLEKDELKLFLQTTKTYGIEQDYPIFMLLAYTGLRAGELCALKWSDINFKEQTLSVSKTYYNPKNVITKYKLLTPKTEASIRVIDIDSTIIDLLKEHRAFQNKVIFNIGKNYHKGNFLFADFERYPGFPFYIKKIGNRMKRILTQAKLNTNLTPHSLRHTHTSLLAQARVPLELIMERLGHEDEKVTKKIYLHVTKDMKKEASIKFSNLMNDL